MREAIPRWNAPSVDYLEIDSEATKTRVIESLESALGRTLKEGDPVRLVALSFANEIINLRSAINISAQLNNLAYAQGEYLDAWGVSFNCPRLSASSAVCDLQFTLSTSFNSVYTIPAGTQVSNGAESIFATDEDLIFEAGETVGTVSASSTNAGATDNGLPIGSLRIMVNPLPYVQSVSNTTQTAGGSNVESDLRYAERLHDVTNSITTAGPYASYRYHAMSVSPAIADVQIFTPSPGIVQVYILLEDGALPTQTILGKVQTYLSADDIRPLGDLVQVLAPEVISYNIRGSYYIDRTNQAQGLAIQDAVNAAVNDYVKWQNEKIGRDINRDELIKRMIVAGAKRVELELPYYSILANYQIANIDEINMIFYGYEEG